jgi:ABC-type nitrate/sulfonate/bicarbonate transport system ATPase subunit
MNAFKPITPDTQLKLSHISKRFMRKGRSLLVLDRLSLEINPQELVALVGPSGCGKTTLLHIVSGLSPPDSGEIFLNHERVADARSDVAYMQQKDLLLPWRTALTNTLVYAEVAGEDLSSKKQEAIELFQVFGLAGCEDVYPAELSGGMRQRVALIRTLLCHKSLLLLDEPFGALDALTRGQLQDWFLHAWQRFGFSALFVTHDVEETLMLADRIYVLSARPAQVQKVFDIALPRPRLATDSEFVRLKAELLDRLSREPSAITQEGGYDVAS